MQVHYLGHIVFYVKDLKTSLHFYRDILGLQEIGPAKQSFKAAALTSGRTHHELLLIEVGTAPGPPTGARRGFYHAGFKVGDSMEELKKVLAELKNAGIEINGMSDHTVSKSIYVFDPDGNEIELYIDDKDIDWKKNPELVLVPIKPLDLS